MSKHYPCLGSCSGCNKKNCFTLKNKFDKVIPVSKEYNSQKYKSSKNKRLEKYEQNVINKRTD